MNYILSHPTTHISFIVWNHFNVYIKRRRLPKEGHISYHTDIVLRSRHFFGRHRLRLRKSKTPGPNPALTKNGRLRLQEKKGGSMRL